MVYYLVFPSVFVLLMESPLQRNTEQGPAIVGIDRPRCLRLYPVVVAVNQGGAGARIVAGVGAGRINHGVHGAHEPDQSARRNGIHRDKSSASIASVEILQGYGQCHKDTHLGAALRR